MPDRDEQRAAREPVALASGDTLLGRYQLHEKLGSGGMGVVFRATHTSLRSAVAVKVMHEPLTASPSLVERFSREARALVLLDHPNIVRVFDLGDVQGRPFIAMELLSGVNFADWMARFGGALPPLSAALELLAQACDGLAAAHAAGLVHRDLKPENLWVVESPDTSPRLKILDFGLVHVDRPMTDATLTHVNDVAGTPAYMSPEQCRSLRVGPSADLYAMGCILHRVLTGHDPFGGGNAIDVIARQMYAPIPELERPEGSEPVPPSLERLRRGLLAKEAPQRPASAALVAQALRDALRAPSEPAPVRPSRPPRGVVFPVAAPRTAGDSQQVAVTLVRLDHAEPGLDEANLLALATAGLRVDSYDAQATSTASSLYLIDAGSRPRAEVLDALRKLRLHTTGVRCVVCARQLDALRIAELVEAGASEVIPLPTSAELMLSRIQRLRRRTNDLDL
jgi:eukaryotic-like serine/threonine-protein kinase